MSRGKKGRTTRKKRAGSQYRRKDWEDGGGIDDTGKPNPIAEPRLVLPPRTAVRPGPDRVEILYLRHEAKTRLWHPRDVRCSCPFDYVAALTSLGKFMVQVVLSSRGLRRSASGISRVPGPKRGDPPRYRAEAWDPEHRFSTRDHFHIGYAATEGEAKDLRTAWYRDHCGLDVRVQPPEWLKICLADAMQLQAEESDEHGGLAWGMDAS